MYVIATIKPWNIKNFKLIKSKKFKLISKPNKLTFNRLKKINPKYIFFPHWSKKVNKKIINSFYCICFHETNLPFGRGGTPIQNLIIRDKKNSTITAFKMSNKLDAGNIILKKNFKLNGSAQEIYENCSIIIFKMIKQIIKKKIVKTKPQKGGSFYFKRLKNNSEIVSEDNTLNKIYNKIRMLDAETYKNAYLKKNNFIYRFFSVKKIKNALQARVIIKGKIDK